MWKQISLTVISISSFHFRFKSLGTELLSLPLSDLTFEMFPFSLTLVENEHQNDDDDDDVDGNDDDDVNHNVD